MIFIKKNQRNIIAVTLNETSRVTSPFFLFEFESDGSKNDEKIIFISPDISSHPNRINIFELIEGENGSKTFANGHESLSSGESHLNLMRGQYTYKVYESTEIVESVEETTGRIVEQGIMVVQSTEDENGEQLGTNQNIYE